MIWDEQNFIVVQGAESFEYKDGYLYSGLQGGDIIRLDIMKDDSESLKDASWQKVGKIGKPCNSIIHEDDCGRPLGLAFDNYGYLLVADAYYGLYSFDVHTGTYYQKITTVLKAV